MKHSSRSGFTVLEMVITLSVMGLATTMLSAAMGSARPVDRTIIDARAAQRAVDLAAATFYTAGVDQQGGVDYPQITTLVQPVMGTNGQGAPVVLQGAQRTVNFLLVADDDNDGWPDISPLHEPIWQATPAQLNLVPDGEGTNFLVYQAPDGTTRNLGKRVVRLDVEDWNTSPADVPLGTVRITLEVLRRDAYVAGTTITVQRTVRLTNASR